MSSSKVIYIGTPETDAHRFAERARRDFPTLALFATNDRAEALEHARDAEVMIGHHFQFSNELLAAAPRLRWIQSLTTGTDALLKLSALRQETVVTSTRGMHGPQMSELVFLQMLALLRDFPRMQRNQAARHWERWPQPLLAGKTAVIVGVGAVAEHLAPRCKAFDMKVIGISQATRLPPGFDVLYTRRQLSEAAAQADFLILIVPLSEETENLIDGRVIAAMKPSAYLINVARGGVLDEKALMQALRERRLAGAALDVFRQRPLPPDDPLWLEDRVIITPHIGGMSDIYLDQAYSIVSQNLERYLAGRVDQLINIVPR